MARPAEVGRWPASLLCALVVGACGGGGEPASEAREGRLELLASIGESGFDATEASPAVLGGPIAVATLPGETLVLDQQAARVVHFTNEGELLGAAGREGEGPGEFGLARHLTLVGDSAVSVLDYEGGRVTIFRLPSLELGEVISGIPGRGFFHAWVGDTIWVVRPNVDGPTSPLATAHLAGDGSEVERAPPADPDDQPFGGAFGLAVSPDRIVTSTRRPGIWWERVGGEWRRVGEPLFPDAPPEKRVEIEPRQFRVIPSPARASDIALLDDTLVVQRHVLQPGIQEADDPRDVPREIFLGIFDLTGDHLGSIRIDDAETCLGTDSGGVILLCSWEPYPQVRRYRLSSVR